MISDKDLNGFGWKEWKEMPSEIEIKIGNEAVFGCKKVKDTDSEVVVDCSFGEGEDKTEMSIRAVK